MQRRFSQDSVLTDFVRIERNKITTEVPPLVFIMAQWKTYTIKDIIGEIECGNFVLPIIQRELVWDKDKIIALFETIMLQESFGGIMTVKEPAKKEPLFAYRSFIKNYLGQTPESKEHKLTEKEISYVIDGQQRLSAIYIGITGEYNDESLYFDLNGESQKGVFNFTFAKDDASNKLTKDIDNYDASCRRKTAWIKVADLYQLAIEAGGMHQTIMDDDKITDFIDNGAEHLAILDNVLLFMSSFLMNPVVGVCSVDYDKHKDIDDNRVRIVRLFQKLNQGGTKLTAIELMRSFLKSYSVSNERFLNEIRDQYSDFGFNQDAVIKYIFLLRNDFQKDISNIKKEDSTFIENNEKRIKLSLEATRKFLQKTKLYNYIRDCRPSIVPLEFIAYYIFYLNKSDNEVKELFDNAELDSEFKSIRKWLVLSYLNHVYQRGSGWDPNKTARKLLLATFEENKGKVFPIVDIHSIYREKLNSYDDILVETIDKINSYERNLVVYLMYDDDTITANRQNDIDHIHPKSILEQKGYEGNQIYSICNFQLLWYRANRSKQDMEFYKFMDEVVPTSVETKNKDIEEYMKLHLIPERYYEGKDLWDSNNFLEFIEARKSLIFSKIKKYL